MSNVVLKPTLKSEYESFKKNLQEAFIIAVEENFGVYDKGSIPSDEEIERWYPKNKSVGNLYPLF